MGLTIKHAVKEQSKLRLALAGTAGSGKTWTSLVFGTVLAEGGKIVLIDTEHGRSQKYADVFDFDIIELDTFSPKVYIEALGLAYKEGAAVVIIDSLSHAWNGEDGILEQVGRNFNNWKEATPLQNKLINTIQRTPYHLIATMRSKTEYVVETVNGKSTPRKVGTAIVQRNDVDFEFDVFGMMDREHNLLVEKSVCRAVPVGKSYNEPDDTIAKALLHWLKDGKAATPTVPAELTQEPMMPSPSPLVAVPAHDTEPMASDRQLTSIRLLCQKLGRPEPTDPMTFVQARDLITQLSRAYSETGKAS